MYTSGHLRLVPSVCVMTLTARGGTMPRMRKCENAKAGSAAREGEEGRQGSFKRDSRLVYQNFQPPFGNRNHSLQILILPVNMLLLRKATHSHKLPTSS